MRASLLFVIVAACGSKAGSGGGPDANPPDASPPDAGKDEACASTFGQALTNAFGRLDGTVVAVVQPGDQRCAQPNSTHLVLQLSMNSDVYRMVVNVSPDSGDPMIRMRTLDMPMPAPAFSEGWHTGILLDYPTSLNVHSTDAEWQALSVGDATAMISDAIALGTPVSVYATSSGPPKADSAHLVHREGGNQDGAIVIDPMGATSHWLLFHFSDQTF
jgi:hypothetical protein